jgi:hypothetical protein
MSRVLRFSKAVLANAALIAREHGVSVKLDRDGSILFFPDIHKAEGLDKPQDDAATALRKWKDKRDEGKPRGRP